MLQLALLPVSRGRVPPMSAGGGCTTSTALTKTETEVAAAPAAAAPAAPRPPAVPVALAAAAVAASAIVACMLVRGGVKHRLVANESTWPSLSGVLKLCANRVGGTCPGGRNGLTERSPRVGVLALGKDSTLSRFNGEDVGARELGDPVIGRVTAEGLDQSRASGDADLLLFPGRTSPIVRWYAPLMGTAALLLAPTQQVLLPMW